MGGWVERRTWRLLAGLGLLSADEDAVESEEGAVAIEGEAAGGQPGRGCASDPRRLLEVAFDCSLSWSALAFALAGALSAVATFSGAVPSPRGDTGSARDGSSPSSASSSSSSPSGRGAIAGFEDAAAAVALESEPLEAIAASAFFVCCLVFARRFWNQT